MAIIYIRLRNPSETVYFQSILGTYSHIAWIRTEKPKEGVIKLISTDNLVDELREILKNLRAEIEFEEVEI